MNLSKSIINSMNDRSSAEGGLEIIARRYINERETLKGVLIITRIP